MNKQDQLEELLVDWELQRRQGRVLSVRDMCQDFPELVPELDRLVKNFKATDWLEDDEEESEAEFLKQPNFETVSGRADSTQDPAQKLSVEEFCERLAESGLIDAKQVATLHEQSAGKTATKFASQLVKAKTLTRFQAIVLHEGRNDPLVLDRYVILDKIGAGGMGVVYKARHQQMDRIVALKVLPREAVNSSKKVKRFQREVQAAARLEHPNIVVAYDATEWHGTHFLVMSYIHGMDFAKMVGQQGPLSISETVNSIIQAARGLGHAHQMGIVHRDVKPGNLLFDNQGVVKILDMGLARIQPPTAGSDEPRLQELTVAGMVMGTVAYQAPEQALDTRSADARSDIYSLGCTLYFLLTGKSVYIRESLMKTMLAHREAAIPSLCDERNDVPQELDEVFQKMVAKRPEDRFQTMNDVIAALDDIKRPEVEEPQPRPASSPSMDDTERFMDTSRVAIQTQPSPTSQPPGTVRRGLIALGCLGVLALLVGLLIRLETPAGTVVLEIDQPELAGATVSVDGKKKITIQTGEGQEAIEVTADEKRHQLEVSMAGFKTFTNEFSFKTGKQQTIQVRLEAVEKPKPIVAAKPKETPKKTPAQQGKQWALMFDGKDDYVAIPSFPINNSAMTIELYLSVDQLWQNSTILLVPFGKDYLTLNDYNGSIGHDAVYENNVLARISINEFPKKQAVHLAGVWDGENSRLFVDGRLVAESQTQEKRYSGYANSPIFLGAKSTSPSHFAGTFDEVRISNVVRYDKDFTPTRKFENDKHTLALYHFEEGRENVLKDSSGNGHHGKVVGATWAQVNDDLEVVGARIPSRDTYTWPKDAPPPAVSLFDAEHAKKVQQEWAKYLNAPVEKTVKIGNNVDLTMVLIPPGEFMMGSTKEEQEQAMKYVKADANPDNWALERIPSESPRHRVRITEPFYMAKYETTQTQWLAIQLENPSERKGQNLPVENVSWNQAQEFVGALNRSMPSAELSFSLPTEAQWEYACRAGTTERWHFGDNSKDLAQYGWSNEISNYAPHPVGQLLPNPWNLYDMIGNVREWCLDWHEPYSYTNLDINNPIVSRENSNWGQVTRGGSAFSKAETSRTAYRHSNLPDHQTESLGFRLVAKIRTKSE